MLDMTNRTMISTLAALACVGLMPSLAAANATKVKCTEVIARLEAEISKEPSRVLLSVEDALNSNDSCACDIIKTAITTSHADVKLVGEIVSTAINTVPTAASTIGECALTTAPEAAKEIKTAMQTVLGQGDGVGKAPLSNESAGKEPIGKEPISAGKTPIMLPPAAVTDSDIAVLPIDIQGIYFAVPGGGGTSIEVKKIVTKIVKVIKKECHCCPPVYVPATKS
jgi:hypothetical protein